MRTDARLRSRLKAENLGHVVESILAYGESGFRSQRNADLPQWMTAVDNLSRTSSGGPEMLNGCLCFGQCSDIRFGQEVEVFLRVLCPWRKGPVRVHGVHLDTEWRSDFKWDRVRPHITPLAGRRILDVGCGNGYFGFRMALQGASLVLGIEPYLLSVAQFLALDAVCHQDRVFVLPVRVEDVRFDNLSFDTVFSMGLLYHQRDPLTHLQTLRKFLRPGGEVILETLIVNGKTLIPAGRYAGMRNVWCVPSPERIMMWLESAGFCRIRQVDFTRTTSAEQRRTEWMTYASLEDFLDPSDEMKTREGCPSPIRAIFVAERSFSGAE